MAVSRLDTAYRSLVFAKFFTKGWGKPENLKKLFEFRKVVSKRESCYQLVPTDYPVTITKETISSDMILLEGHFQAPFEEHLPGLLPEACRIAYFQVLLPKKWQSDYFKPVCLHLAGTGDHFFFRRRNFMAKPLLKDAGIGGILLENPFYGTRKPKDQRWSSLHNVSDIFVMGGCLILESLVLFHWCKRNGLGPFGLTGISMGGHMASLAATNWPEPLVLVPCLSWTTASAVFTRGVMSSAINWDLLEDQYFSDECYRKEIKQMVKIVENDACYAAGQHFAKNFPESLDHVNRLAFSGTNSDKTKSGSIKLVDYLGWRSKETARSNDESTSASSKKDSRTDPDNKLQALQFMCGMMDECTHLSNFSVPVDTELIISVTAKDDAYVPRDGLIDIRDVWPGVEVRYLNSGHIGAFLLHQKVFRAAIAEAFQKLKKKYYEQETDVQNTNSNRNKSERTECNK